MLEQTDCMEIEINVETQNLFDLATEDDEFADVEDDIETYKLFDEGEVLDLETRLADLISGETFNV